MIIFILFPQTFLNVLKSELKRIPSSNSHLCNGIGKVMSTLNGDDPWEAKWPACDSTASLTRLMVEAARVNCNLTTALLHQAGAQAFSCCTVTGVTPLHAALEAGHWRLAQLMTQDMDAFPYLVDTLGRLPLDIEMPPNMKLLLQKVGHYTDHSFQLFTLCPSTPQGASSTNMLFLHKITKLQSYFFIREPTITIIY